MGQTRYVTDVVGMQVKSLNIIRIRQDRNIFDKIHVQPQVCQIRQCFHRSDIANQVGTQVQVR